MAEALSNMCRGDDDPLTTAISAELRLALDQLAQARRYTAELACDCWEFAVELDRLLAAGVTTSDLRWLIKRGWIEHRREITTSDATDRTFAPRELNLAFSSATCFVLSDEGARMVNSGRWTVVGGRNEISMAPCDLMAPCDSVQMALSIGSRAQATDVVRLMALSGPNLRPFVPSPTTDHRPPSTNVVPNWDRVARVLLVGDAIVKRYRVPSPNQEALLDAFQEEGWPASIDDPLTPLPDQQPKRRLRDTIKCLNLNQATRMLRFRGDGTGQRVLWELLAGQVGLNPTVTIDQSKRRAA